MVWSKGPISVRAYPLGMNWEKVMLLPLEWDAFPLYVNLQNFVRAPAHSAIAGLNYNKTCIEWHCMKLSPCINHLIFIVQNFVSLITVISSSIYQLPLLSSHDQPLLYPSGLFLLFVACIEQSLKVGLLKWNLEQSSSKIYPYVSRKINVSGVFLSKSLYIKWSLMVQNCIFNLFFFFLLYPLSVKNLSKYSSPIPRVWPHKTGSTVLGGEMDCKSKFICQRFGQNYPARVQMEASLSKVKKF